MPTKIGTFAHCMYRQQLVVNNHWIENETEHTNTQKKQFAQKCATKTETFTQFTMHDKKKIQMFAHKIQFVTIYESIIPAQILQFSS